MRKRHGNSGHRMGTVCRHVPITVRSGRGGSTQRRPLSWAVKRAGVEETCRLERGRQAWAPLVPCVGQMTGGHEVWQFPAPHGDFRCPGLAVALFVRGQSAGWGLAGAVGVCWELCPLGTSRGLPWWLSSKKKNCLQCRRFKRRRFDPRVGKISLRRKWLPTPVSCLENPMDRGA